MIRTPTTFVIGAGASASYDVPAARALADSLISGSGLPPHIQLDHWRGKEKEFRRLGEALRGSGCYSIDELLEQRPDLSAIGREAIVAMLSWPIFKALQTAVPSADDWIRRLINEMRDGCKTAEDFVDKNRVRFLTFNFDLLLEHKFRAALMSLYQLEADQAHGYMRRLSITHLHGTLSVPDHRSNISPTWIAEAAGSIRIVHDELDQAELENARNYIRETTVLCFLGFSFHRLNLERLGIPGTLAGVAHMYGTTKGMGGGEVALVRQRVGHDRGQDGPPTHHFELADETCDVFLKQHFVLRG